MYSSSLSCLFQIKRYFVSFWNGVDLRYRLLKGPKIRISIAGIIISRVSWFIRNYHKSHMTWTVDKNLVYWVTFCDYVTIILSCLSFRMYECGKNYCSARERDSLYRPFSFVFLKPPLRLWMEIKERKLVNILIFARTLFIHNNPGLKWFILLCRFCEWYFKFQHCRVEFVQVKWMSRAFYPMSLVQRGFNQWSSTRQSIFLNLQC